MTVDNASLTFATFSGTDINKGGCTAGDRVRVTGSNIVYIANQLNGTSTCSTQGEIAEREAHSPEASFEITGTVTSETPRDPAQSSPY
jgi:hypothetical protein